MPKISVLMSVYNEPVDWMRQAIESILNQTYKDFEFIIVNDNPEREENQLVLNEYRDKDSRIIILCNEHNIGLTKSLNRGLAVANGEYVARMDADDIALPERLEKQLVFMEANPDVLVSGAQAIIIDELGYLGHKWKMLKKWEYLKNIILFQSPVLHPLAFFKRKLNGKPLIYDENMIYAQDYALWSSLIKNNKIANIDDVLLYYRISGSQISSKKYNQQSDCAVKVQEKIFSDLNYQTTPDIRKVINVITKKRYIKIETTDVVQSLIEFYQYNFGVENDVNFLVKQHIYIVLCNYLPLHYGLIRCLVTIIIFSLRIRYFKLCPICSMVFKKIIKRKVM